jgi:hypothetical protein
LVTQLLALPGSLGTNPEALDTLRRCTGEIGSDEPRDTRTNVSRDSLATACIDLVRATAWEKPVCVLVDDWEKLDDESQRLLHQILGSLREDRVLTLLACNSAALSKRARTFSYHELGRLSLEDSEALAHSLIKDRTSIKHSGIAATIAELSGGLPASISAACHSVERLAAVSGAVSLVEFLRHRVETLGTDERTVLLTAILLGDDTSIAEITSTLPDTCYAAEEALTTLNDEGLIRIRANGRVHVSESCSVGQNSLFSPQLVAIRRHFIAERLRQRLPRVKDADTRLQLKAARLLRDDGQLEYAAELFARAGTSLGERGLPWSAATALSSAAALSGPSDASPRLQYERLVNASAARDRTQQREVLASSKQILLQSTELSAEERNEVLVCSVEAYTLGLDEEAFTVEASLELLRSAALSSVQRLRVAVAGLHAADHISDVAAVKRIAALTRAVPTDSPDGAEYHSHILLVAALAERRIRDAVAIGEQFASALSDKQHPLQRATVLRHSRIPHWYDCNHVRSSQLAHAALAEVASYPSSYAYVLVQDVMATEYIEVGDALNAASHIDQAIATATEFGHRAALPSLAEMRLRNAVLTRALPNEDDPVLAFLKAPDLPDRTALYTNCARVILAARKGDLDAVANLMPLLTRAWKQLSKGCPFDYAAIAFAIGTLSSVSRKAAVEALGAYLSTGRLAAFPLSAFSKSLLDEFGLLRTARQWI